MGAALTQRPDLFRAVVCQVPLLDMLRYHKFLIARLWIPEYGSADDPEQFKWLYAYSPYQHVKDGTAYPAVLIEAAESDSRVDPLHARKMTARLQAATSSDPSETDLAAPGDEGRPRPGQAARQGGRGVDRCVELFVLAIGDEDVWLAATVGAQGELTYSASDVAANRINEPSFENAMNEPSCWHPPFCSRPLQWPPSRPTSRKPRASNPSSPASRPPACRPSKAIGVTSAPSTTRSASTRLIRPKRTSTWPKPTPARTARPSPGRNLRRFPLGSIVNLKLFKQSDDCVVYLYHEIKWTGDDAASVAGQRRLHQGLAQRRKVVVADNAVRPAAADQDQATLKLKPGKNQLLLKVGNIAGGWEVYVAPELPPSWPAKVRDQLASDFPTTGGRRRRPASTPPRTPITASSRCPFPKDCRPRSRRPGHAARRQAAGLHPPRRGLAHRPARTPKIPPT